LRQFAGITCNDIPIASVMLAGGFNESNAVCSQALCRVSAIVLAIAS
jgi:hypothetical protein